MLAAEIITKALTSGQKVNVKDIVSELRSQRFGLIQTASQYVYLHFSICTYCERKLQNNPNAAEVLKRHKEFVTAYRDFAKNEELQDRKLAAQGFDTRQSTARK